MAPRYISPHPIDRIINPSVVRLRLLYLRHSRYTPHFRFLSSSHWLSLPLALLPILLHPKIIDDPLSVGRYCHNLGFCLIWLGFCGCSCLFCWVFICCAVRCVVGGVAGLILLGCSCQRSCHRISFIKHSIKDLPRHYIAR